MCNQTQRSGEKSGTDDKTKKVIRKQKNYLGCEGSLLLPDYYMAK